MKMLKKNIVSDIIKQMYKILKMKDVKKLSEEIIYVDNAATTKVSKACLDAMMPFFKDNYGNPSSIYKIAHKAKFALEKAREKAAKAVGANQEEIFFTSCGTESNNWAIKSCALLGKEKGKTHLITSNIEHHSVSHSFKSLEKQGYNVTYLPVNSDGLINPNQVKKAITKETALVSIMYANNEIGTIQPIKEIAKICKEKDVTFHTDAVQAVGHVDICLKENDVNLLSISGHKIHAPKGIGILYIKKGTKIKSFLDGGGQEKMLRAGTENVAFATAIATALEIATKNIEEKENKVKALRDMLLQRIEEKIEKFRVNGTLKERLSSNLNLSFEGIEGESLLLLLDSKNICASSGSACTSNSLDPSHVLLAIGLKPELAHGSLRISLSEENTKEEIDKIVEVLVYSVNRLRKMSPIWN